VVQHVTKARGYIVIRNVKLAGVIAALACIVFGMMTAGASAITVEVAKKCNALTAKEYPPREVGNPAAGSAKGTGQAQRNYFSKCVTNGGNLEDHEPKEAK
jgi:hypothetical protein